MNWKEDYIEVCNSVYIIRQAKDPEYVEYYIYRVKMDNGQTVEMEIWQAGISVNELSKQRIWFIVLNIPTKKKKGYEYLKQTGKLGITGLLIAKGILKYHIENVINHDKYHEHVIVISADNNVRMNVYERGLKDSGFKILDNISINKMNFGRVLVKKC